MDTLKNGSAQLKAGINTADNSVVISITSADNSLKSTDGLDNYAQTPVKMEENDVNAVPDYGTGFAPFFLSLSLYIGAIMMFFGIHFDTHKRIKVLSTNSDSVVLRTGLYLLIGVAQAVVMGVIIQYSLNLKIANLGMYYFASILFSLVAVSVVQFLIIHAGDLGKLLTIILLIFQLTSSGGTFPIETVPAFYRSLSAFLPMTYSIDLFKQSIASYHAENAHFDMLVQIGFIVVFTALTIGILLIKKARANAGSIKPLQGDRSMEV